MLIYSALAFPEAIGGIVSLDRSSHSCIRVLLAALGLLIPSLCSAATVQSGNYIVVRGAVIGCEAWDDRILDLVEVGIDDQQTIVGIAGIDFVGLDLEELETIVLDAIEDDSGARPKTLKFELLPSVLQIKTLIDPYLGSMVALEVGQCPQRYDESRYQPPGVDDYKEVSPAVIMNRSEPLIQEYREMLRREKWIKSAS